MQKKSPSLGRPSADEGKTLSEIRQELGLSRAELGQAIGRSEKTIRLVERGHQRFGDAAWQRVRRLQRGEPTLARVADSAEPTLYRIAELIAQQSVKDAVAALVNAGIAESEAWRMVIGAKLK